MRRLLTTVAATAVLPVWAIGQPISVDCTLVDGVLPAECQQPNAGMTVAMPTGENTELEVFESDLGDQGFSISIDAAVPGQTPVLLEGDPVRVNEYRRVDRILADNNVEVRFDGLNIDPRLAVSTDSMRSSFTAGETVRFRTSSNYPAYINRAEIRVADARNPARVVARIPVEPNGSASWTMPSDTPRDMVYSLRVYDDRNRYDETKMLSLWRSARRLADPVLDGPVIAAGEAEDMTRRRGIPVSGGAVTVFSNGLSPNSTVTVMGETVPVDAKGAFVVQRILPVGAQLVQVGVGPRTFERPVDIPADDWFYIATLDLTVGKENDEVYRIGRVAGFAKGRTASGWQITGAVDTTEGDLDEIFRDFDAREPLNLIRSIRDEDVFLTFGDDSTLVEEAPTSGKLYLRAEKDGSHILLGDFKLADEDLRLVRSDRTLFGVEGEYVSPQLTNEGRPRLRFYGYAAQPDRLAQRDVLEGTGGYTYFLNRQGILSGTATIFVQWRDPVSGRIVREERLEEGTDYTINYFQGLVQLTQPLSPYAGDSLLADGGLGRYDVQLVAQYEYVPTLTDIDGTSAGLRIESWLNDNVRLGFSAQREQTGPADNTLKGADLLLRKSDLTYLQFEVAESEGPGFGFTRSPNGGFDFGASPSAGAKGLKARAIPCARMPISPKSAAGPCPAASPPITKRRKRASFRPITISA